MHQDQIALMAKQRKKGALSRRVPLHFPQSTRGFLGDFRSFSRRERLPGCPFDTLHLMQDARPFERQWNGRK